jgi:hypothetical protein
VSFAVARAGMHRKARRRRRRPPHRGPLVRALLYVFLGAVCWRTSPLLAMALWVLACSFIATLWDLDAAIVFALFALALGIAATVTLVT